jgi:hypothetical protein
MAGSKSDSLAAVITLVVLVGLIVGGAFWYRSCQGGKMGAQCTEGNLGCKPGFFCALDVCTAKCSSNGDCAEGWTCGDLEVKHILGPSEVEVGKDVIRACLPPRAAR